LYAELFGRQLVAQGLNHNLMRPVAMAESGEAGVSWPVMMKCQAFEGQRFLLCFIAQEAREERERDGGKFLGGNATAPHNPKDTKQEQERHKEQQQRRGTQDDYKQEQSGTWDNHQFNDKRQRSQAA
jgi:hypothetical protein